MPKDNSNNGPQRPGRALVTLPPDLRAALDREAFAHDRSLTSEIVRRLKASFEGTSYAVPMLAKLVAEQRASEPDAWSAPLAKEEQELLSAFRKLPKEKQLALLALLR